MIKRTAIAWTLFLLAGSPARAADDVPAVPSRPLHYVLGVGASRQPEYAGSRRYDSGLSPVWALRWGRWRLSSGGGSALLGFGQEVYGAGASTDLFDTDRLRVGLSLRLDGGRHSNDADTTRGLPDVRRTVRGRLFATYALSDDVRFSGALSQDLLGHHGGLIATADLGWRLFHSPGGELTAGLGVTAGNGRYMQSYFGTPTYGPGGGLRDAHAGVGYMRLIGKRWILFSGAGASVLLGPAADSPLTQRRLGRQINLGIAYRH